MALQAAAYVGFEARGLSGAAVTCVDFDLPAFAMMFSLSVICAFLLP